MSNTSAKIQVFSIRRKPPMKPLLASRPVLWFLFLFLFNLVVGPAGRRVAGTRRCLSQLLDLNEGFRLPEACVRENGGDGYGGQDDSTG